MIKLATFGVACVAAVGVSHFAREGRRCATTAAWVILVNWLLFVWPWVHAPSSPAFIVSEYGPYTRQEDMWALTDLLSLVAIVWVCRGHWWSPAIWISYLCTLTVFAMAFLQGIEYTEYSVFLDAALVVQLAVIFTIGGPGCADYLSHRWHRLRGVVRSPVNNCEAAS